MVSFKKKINIVINDGNSFSLRKNLRLNALTLEGGEPIDVKVGEIYLGRDVKDLGEKGISHIEEIEGILEQMEIDKRIPLPIGEFAIRLNELAVRVGEGNGEFKKQGNKMKAFLLINHFRRSIGLYPLEYGKYLKKTTLIKRIFKRKNKNIISLE